MDLGRGTVEAAVGAASQRSTESPLQVTLVQGVARGERMDLMVQKATELGVAAIAPVATARSIVRLDATRATQARALARRRRCACEQCGRARVPVLAEPQPLATRLAAPASGLRILLAPGADVALAAAAHGAQAVELLVGPEGGLDDGEREAALAAGYRACRLGPRVLRSETAAIAAIAILQAVAGDLGGV